MKIILPLLVATTVAWPQLLSATDFAAADSINESGIRIYQQQAETAGNICLSPYSIVTALAMTYAGSDGETQAQMATTLGFPADAGEVAMAFQKLSQGFQSDVKEANANRAKDADPLRLDVANRLFGQKGFQFRKDFLALLADRFDAPLDELDFRQNVKSAAIINRWVEAQTEKKIRDLVPANALNEDTRLVLVNALYFRAGWRTPFEKEATKDGAFHVSKEVTRQVPFMQAEESFGYKKFGNFEAIALPYGRTGDFQFLILLPAASAKISSVEKQLTPELLGQLSKLPVTQVRLSLPRFKLEPGTLALSDTLKKFGMPTAFDVPQGSANFDRMAPRRPNEYLYISEVLHKTFLDVNEAGTEAAAATAVIMMRALAIVEPGPEVKVDRPFLFAIQHVPSSTCLFLGRLSDPAP